MLARFIYLGHDNLIFMYKEYSQTETKHNYIWSPRRSTIYYFTGYWVGTTASRQYGEDKTRLPLMGIESSPLSSPASSSDGR
jgi:hypothetical protein